MKKITSQEIFELLKKNESLLKRYSVKKIGLFGSQSRNDSSESSDIDFLVDFEEKTFDNFIDLNFALEDIFHTKVDLVTEAGASPHIFPYIEKEVVWYEAG